MCRGLQRQRTVLRRGICTFLRQVRSTEYVTDTRVYKYSAATPRKCRRATGRAASRATGTRRELASLTSLAPVLMVESHDTCILRTPTCTIPRSMYEHKMVTPALGHASHAHHVLENSVFLSRQCRHISVSSDDNVSSSLSLPGNVCQRVQNLQHILPSTDTEHECMLLSTHSEYTPKLHTEYEWKRLSVLPYSEPSASSSVPAI